MIQVQSDGNVGALDDSSLNQLHQVGVVGIGAGALGDLEDQGGVDLAGSLSDTLDDLHVVNVESADSVTAVVGLLKHLGSGDQWHIDHLLNIFYGPYCTINDCKIQGCVLLFSREFSAKTLLKSIKVV